MGRYNFDPGDRPLATEWQRDLGDQVIFHEADATARDLDIPASPTDKRKEGMMCANLALNQYEVYNAALARWDPWGRWSDWNVVTNLSLTATTTNPTMGTAPSQYCRWMRLGTLAIMHVFVKFGTGANKGSGIYEIEIPAGIPPNTNILGAQEIIVGSGISVIGTTRWFVSARPVSSTRFRLVGENLAGDVTDANFHGGWTPDGDVVFNGTLHFECV